MKVTLKKKAFTLDEKELIKQFKADWAVPTNEDIALGVNAVMRAQGFYFSKLLAITEIELTKNRFEPTYWVRVVASGYSSTMGSILAEVDFDYVQAMLNAGADDSKIDNFTEIYKRL